MKRILEPELMEDDEQARAYAESDFEEPHGNFIKLFKEIFAGREIGGHVLDVGCGPADITIRFAKAYPGCIVHGVDGSEAMLHYGRKRLAEEYDVEGRVELIQGIVPGAKLPRKKYDAIISNSILHHLENPQVLWKTIKLYAGSGAAVFIMDLKRPATIAEAQQLVETYAADEAEVHKRDFYNSFLAAFEAEEIRAQLKEANLDNLNVDEVSDRHLLAAGNVL
jgi:ubiquinone/menaquinone biosynthesis C-methylase UbiE